MLNISYRSPKLYNITLVGGLKLMDALKIHGQAL